MNCRRRGHNWFPNLGAREFTVGHDTCLRCNAKRAVLPYGMCLGNHRIAEHYTDQGELRPHELVPVCPYGEPV